MCRQPPHAVAVPPVDPLVELLLWELEEDRRTARALRNGFMLGIPVWVAIVFGVRCLMAAVGL